MARYKNYYRAKDDRIGSIRMFGYIYPDNTLTFKYEVWLDDESDNEQRIPMPDKVAAEKYMKKLRFKEY